MEDQNRRSGLSRDAEIVLQIMHIIYCASGFLDSGAVWRGAELWSTANMDPANAETIIAELKEAGFVEEADDAGFRIRLTKTDRRWVIENETGLVDQWKRRAPMMFYEDGQCQELKILYGEAPPHV